MDETTTLTDDEILTVEDGEITQITDDADGDDTDTTDGDSDATPTRTTPTRTPRSPAALGRAVEPFELERFLAEHWERRPLVVPRGEEGRFDDLLSTRDVERLITESGIRAAGVPARQGGRDGQRLHDRPLLAPVAVHGCGRRAAGARGVRARGDDRAPGAAPQLAAARPLLPPAGSVLRPPGAGERLLHPGGLAGPAGPPRHARGDLAPGRGLQALARLRAGARAAAEEPALPLGPRRAGRARARRHVARRRHAVPAARLAPPGADLGRRLAPHHRRHQRQALGRRGAGRARRGRERACFPADHRRRGAAGAADSRRRRRPGTRAGALRQQPSPDPRRPALGAAGARQARPRTPSSSAATP